MSDNHYSNSESTSLVQRFVAQWKAWLLAVVGVAGLAFFATRTAVEGMAQVSYVAHLAAITIVAVWYGIHNTRDTTY